MKIFHNSYSDQTKTTPHRSVIHITTVLVIAGLPESQAFPPPLFFCERQPNNSESILGKRCDEFFRPHHLTPDFTEFVTSSYCRVRKKNSCFVRFYLFIFFTIFFFRFFFLLCAFFCCSFFRDVFFIIIIISFCRQGGGYAVLRQRTLAFRVNRNFYRVCCHLPVIVSIFDKK